MRFRFPIAGLMAVVLVVAIGFAGLRASSLLWASALFSTAVVLFTAAIVAAAACRRPSRFGWFGFGVFGWTYLLAAFWLWPEPNGLTTPPLLTKALLDHLQPTVNTVGVMTIEPGPMGELDLDPLPMAGAMRPVTPATGPVAKAPFVGRFVNLLHYRRIGHALAAIVFSFWGRW